MAINREATIRWKGYDPDNLTHGSIKKVWANCERCGKGRWVQYSGYRDLCMSCSQIINPSKGFLDKHHSQKSIDKISKAKKGKRGTSHTEKSKIAISEGLRNKPKSPEHCKKLSKSIINSDAAKIAAKKQQGGNDIVNHHIAYDFLRPEDLIVKITRKFHGQIHNPKGIQRNKRGYSLID